MEKYAVLISGISVDSGRGGYDEFWNDLVLIREALVKYCNFKANQVFVLYGNGQDHIVPEQVGTRYDVKIVTSPANKIDVVNVFNDLLNGTNGKPKLEAEDLLFVWTFGHGEPDLSLTKYFLGLNDGNMADTDFSCLVNKLSCTKVLCMQQCFGGGFAKKIDRQNTVILTACNEFEIARRCDDFDFDITNLASLFFVQENEKINDNIFHHGEFNYHLYSATTNNTVNGQRVGTYNSMGVVSMMEVFNYIRKKDSIWWGEIPQYCDESNVGNNLFLQR